MIDAIIFVQLLLQNLVLGTRGIPNTEGNGKEDGEQRKIKSDTGGGSSARASIEEIQKALEEYLKAEHRAPGYDKDLIYKDKASLRASSKKHARGKNSTVDDYYRAHIRPVYFYET